MSGKSIMCTRPSLTAAGPRTVFSVPDQPQLPEHPPAPRQRGRQVVPLHAADLVITSTVGRRIEVTVGLTTDVRGNQVIGLAVGGGPSAVLALGGRDNTGGRLIVNLRAALSDLAEKQRRT
ncbi:hypothetical protein [Amycolatopsis sp. NPDC001319]|uniref:hypothetical protein n=1 Tax=unclassified Amycolatopsis TaxID=2618356 RepID=UPI0036909D5D